MKNRAAVLLAITVSFALAQAPDPFATPAKAVVLLFTRSDCPVSNRYAPEVRRIYARFKDRDVRFFLVYPDRDETPQTIAQHRADFRYPFDSIRDPKHVLVAKSHAQVTPEAAIFVPNGKSWQLVYHGRIDDRNADFGKSRPEPNVRDLNDTLTAVLAGKPAPRTEAKAVGCYISDLR